MTNATPQRRFDIALSFPGEHRPFVEQVATQLAATFSQDRVLYDKYHDAEFARLDLDVYLPNLYRTESELIVLFLCPEYANKRWCGLECRFIRQLIGTPDAKRIMFLSIGNTGDYSEFGILPGDGYIEIGAQSAEVIAEKIRKRLNLNRGVTAPAPTVSIPADISRIVKYAPVELIGREDETALLNDAWAKVQTQAKGRPHLLTFVAMGGEGKTSLVAKWAATLAHQDWPGCDAVFAWSFYSQGTREQVAASSDVFLREALIFFGDEATANSAKHTSEKARRLAQLVGQRRALLILDGVEPLQYPPLMPMNGQLRDQGLADLLKALATTNRGLCVVTTRYSLPDLQAFWQTTAAEQKLWRLSREAGVRLLKTLCVKGAAQEFDSLVEEVKGHALTLNLLGTYLRDAHQGDIRRRDLVRLAEADAEEQGGHAFRVMAAYERWLEGSESRLQAETARSAAERAESAQPPKGGTLNNGQRALAILRLMGLFDRPATADCLYALWQSPAIPNLTEPLIGITEAQRNLTLKRLEDARLLTVNRDAAGTLLSLDAHPLLREYFAARVQSSGFSRSSGSKPPEGGTLNAAWREAHRRVYEHLCATTKDKPDATLEDLQPLYQAVAHGCQAGLQEDACAKIYRDRIQRGREAYSTKKLGAFGSDLGAVVCFFEQPWNHVWPTITETAQAWLLNEAAFALRALGRLTEAVTPLRVATEWAAKTADWKRAAIGAGNLSELELTLGNIAKAVENAEQCVSYADQSGDVGQRVINLTTLADALYQAGRRSEARASFHEAEQLQAESRFKYPLYALQGFRHCDFILAEAERTAWKVRGADSELRGSVLIEACSVISRRAARTLNIAEQHFGFQDIGLDHLTLGRTALYSAILESTNSQLPTASSQLEAAVSYLHRAGGVEFLVRALLTRAWLRSLTGARTGQDSAQEDLEEAWDIASRGSMKLHLADIHLHRARLFGLRNADFGLRIEEPYPWESPEHDLAEAERLIKECGYHRRDEELADAKRAILGQ
ncbi:MAG: hypothetical protein JST85_24155 [Acidobacteria bacterium]|nr:hypothetical protein [Acidobacteriota bacterium]